MNETDFYKRLLEEKGLELVDNLYPPKKPEVKIDDSLQIEENTATSSKKIFDDIDRFYQFKKKNYKKAKLPWIMSGGGLDKLDYAKFLEAGTSSRFCTTIHLIDVLKEEFGKGVKLKGVDEINLFDTLRLVELPFENAPSTIPLKEELTSSPSFELVKPSSTSFYLIGSIEYLPPHKEVYSGWYGEKCIKFTYGGINLKILGSAISNDSQYRNLLNKLRDIKATPTFNERNYWRGLLGREIA